MGLGSIFNLDMGGLVKLFRQGQITKLYNKMYDLAEYLSIHEMKRHSDEILSKLDKTKKPDEYMLSVLQELNKYRDNRFKFHMDEMKELLKLALKEEDKK